MRIFLIILLIVLVLFIIILCSSIVAAVEFWDGKFTFAVRYFGIKIFPFKKKKEQPPPDPEKEAAKAEKKAKKQAAKDAKKQAEQEEIAAANKKRLLAEKIQRTIQKTADTSDLISNILSAVPRPLQKLLQAVTLDKVETDLRIGGEDAADAAILYGRMQLAVQNLLAGLGRWIHVKRKNVAISCDFTRDNTLWNVRFRLKVRIGTVLLAGIWFGWHYWQGSRKAKKAVISERI